MEWREENGWLHERAENFSSNSGTRTNQSEQVGCHSAGILDPSLRWFLWLSDSSWITWQPHKVSTQSDDDDLKTFLLGVQPVVIHVLFIHLLVWTLFCRILDLESNSRFDSFTWASTLDEQCGDCGLVIVLQHCPHSYQTSGQTLLTQYEEPMKQWTHLHLLHSHSQTAPYEMCLTSDWFWWCKKPLQLVWRDPRPVLSVVQSHDRLGGLLKKLSWLCKAALVLLQSVVGSPEIPTFRSLIRCTYRVLTFSGYNYSFDPVTDITFWPPWLTLQEKRLRKLYHQAQVPGMNLGAALHWHFRISGLNVACLSTNLKRNAHINEEKVLRHILLFCVRADITEKHCKSFPFYTNNKTQTPHS